MSELLKKYRPKSLDDILGQDHVIKQLKAFKSIKELPNLLFEGQPGVGKTATAYALASHLGVRIVEFNASDERGIDFVREKVRTLLFSKGERLILLDEADMMTSQAQHALRRMIERAVMETNSRVIFTANDVSKIIPPIWSRCACYHFKPLNEDVLKKILVRVLKEEGVRFRTKDHARMFIDYVVKVSNGSCRDLFVLVDKLLHTPRDKWIEFLEMEKEKIDVVERCIDLAFSCDFEGAFQTLKSILANYGWSNHTELITRIWKVVERKYVSELGYAQRYELLKALAEAERAIQMGCSPIIQLTAFLADCVAISRMKDGERK